MTGEEPIVYVIILNWNQKALTEACLLSMRATRYPRYRIVLVDNGSVDDSVSYLQERFPEVIHLCTGSNLGFAAGNNVGIEHALKNGADYVYLLNNDTEVDPDFLGPLVAAAEQDDRIGMAGSTVFYFDPPDIIWYAGAHANWLNADMIDPRMGKPFPDSPPALEDVDELAGAGMLVRRAVLEQVGLLDPAFFIYFEETDWCQRAKRAGWRVVWVPTSRIWHKVSMAFGDQSPQMVYLMTRNRWLFMRKNAPNFPLFAAHYLLRMTKRALAFGWQGDKVLRRAMFCGMRDAILGRYGFGALEQMRRGS